MGRKNSDKCPCSVGETDLSSDSVRVCAQRFIPEFIRDNHYVVLIVIKRAAAEEPGSLSFPNFSCRCISFARILGPHKKLEVTMDENLIIAMATSVILATVKNPAKKAALKKVMLKLYTTIGTMYAGDPDFQAASGAGGD